MRYRFTDRFWTALALVSGGFFIACAYVVAAALGGA